MKFQTLMNVISTLMAVLKSVLIPLDHIYAVARLATHSVQMDILVKVWVCMHT